MKKNLSKYYPLLFTHVYKKTPWGGDFISSFRKDVKSTNDLPIGESWELVDRPDSQSFISNGHFEGRSLRNLIRRDPKGIVGLEHRANSPFPLLMKIIDAKQDLSLQVHPDENSCKVLKNAEAKSEMWYILDHKENAQILKGLKEDISINKFKSALKYPEIKNFLNSYNSRNGEAYMIHANTLHSIGGGNLIYEIQQNSNTTYRVSDWGRKGKDGKSRKLHIGEALKCMSQKKKAFRKQLVPKINQIYEGLKFRLQHKNLATCSYFHVDELCLQGDVEIDKSHSGFLVFYAIDGDLNIHSEDIDVTVKKGSTCLIPAGLSKFSIRSSDNTKFLRVKAA